MVVYDSVLGRLRSADPSSALGDIVSLQSGIGDPNGVVTPTKAGGEYLDTASGTKYYAKTAANTSRVEVNYTNP